MMLYFFSGVGFLGAGLIWKGSLSDGSGGEVHQVHGITTAASVWLSAAMGCGAGGALYAVSIYAVSQRVLHFSYAIWKLLMSCVISFLDGLSHSGAKVWPSIILST